MVRLVMKRETRCFQDVILTSSSPILYSSANRAAAQASCCNAAQPAVPSAATQSSGVPAYSGPTGTEPTCNICRDGSYPGIPYGFVIARYVGEYTCDQLYGRGLHGMIPMYMCGPLQDFSQTVCGCGIYNPNRNQAATTTTYSLTARARTYSGTPGTRNLRGSADAEDAEQKALPAPEDLHFETRELPADFFLKQANNEASEPEALEASEPEASESSEPEAEEQAETPAQEEQQ